jgi:hypothetical protein
MTIKDMEKTFSQAVLDNLFPQERSDLFFEALYGDVSEGAYDIRLTFNGHSQNRLFFAFQLTPRPGKCLACSLTYGLPQVFSRHPVIDVNGLIQEINRLLDGHGPCSSWQLETTKELSSELHVIPLTIGLGDQNPEISTRESPVG